MKKIEVRIAVIVDETGKWAAYGYSGGSDQFNMGMAIEQLEEEGMTQRYWITADLDVPQVKEIMGLAFAEKSL